MNLLIKSHLIIVFSFCLFADAQDSIKIVNSGKYYPNIKLTNKDKLSFPIELEIELALKSLRDLNLKSNYFYSETSHAVYSKYDSIYITYSKDTLYLEPKYMFRLY